MEFEVKDMSCDGCANSIRRAVTCADPAAKLDIDVATKVVRIESALPSERLVAIIEEVGFHPTAKVFYAAIRRWARCSARFVHYCLTPSESGIASRHVPIQPRAADIAGRRATSSNRAMGRCCCSNLLSCSWLQPLAVTTASSRCLSCSHR